MDEDRLSPELGRLIDAAKAAAAAPRGPGAPRAEGWALLVGDGTLCVGPDAAAVISAARSGPGKASYGGLAAGAPELLAVAFAIAGEADDDLLPGEDARDALRALDPGLPIVVKHLGRWVVLPLSGLPPA